MKTSDVIIAAALIGAGVWLMMKKDQPQAQDEAQTFALGPYEVWEEIEF